MRKLSFERAILIVLILIVLISTSEAREKFITVHILKNPVSTGEVKPSTSFGFPSMVAAADNYYKAGDYEGAVKQYLTLTLQNTLSNQQKIHVYFRLGLCQYNLKKYDLAFDNFIKVTILNPNDSLAYNNAAVSAYEAKNLKKAIEMQQKALDTLAAVEYYYNMARMLEDNGEYDLAAKNFLAVAQGEQNISKIQHIDPVRVKEKAARLLPKQESMGYETLENIFIALKINDNRELLLVHENEMQLKKSDFIIRVENNKDFNNIVAEYDREDNDPYSLISSLVWTVYKEGKAIYKDNGEKMSYGVKDSGNYEVKLSIKYSGNKEIIVPKTVRIKEDSGTIDDNDKDKVEVIPTESQENRTYVHAIYEQLFESEFKVSSYGYTDKYNVVWGKDGGIETEYNTSLAVDKLTSLVVRNISNREGGLWASFDSLLDTENIKGKTVLVSFYARGISDNVELDISVRVKSNNMIASTNGVLNLPFKFKQKTMDIYIPEDAESFTLSIKASPNKEFNIDAFTIVVLE